MIASPPDLVLFVGHLHPLLVHLPIGGLVVLALLEAVAALTRWKDAAQSSAWIIGIVAVTAMAAATCGCLLASTGGYDAQLLDWHRALGITLVVACLVTWFLRYKGKLPAYRASLFIAVVLLAVVGHLGGSITHGRDFLAFSVSSSAHAQEGARGQSKGAAEGDALQQPVFSGVIEPIFRQRCLGCHGPEKHKADLRLDSFQGLVKGGEDGAVISPGHSQDSLLFQRISLPMDDDHHMPPDARPQLTPEQIAVLKWWIDHGAPSLEAADAFAPDPATRHLLQTVSTASTLK